MLTRFGESILYVAEVTARLKPVPEDGTADMYAHFSETPPAAAASQDVAASPPAVDYYQV